jgi:CcmD family protein
MRLARIVVFVVALAVPVAGQESPPPQPPSGFVAVDEVPPGEQIPAITLVAAAYGFVWVALLAYVWSIGRRLQTVERELAELESRKR